MPGKWKKFRKSGGSKQCKLLCLQQQFIRQIVQLLAAKLAFSEINEVDVEKWWRSNEVMDKPSEKWIPPSICRKKKKKKKQFDMWSVERRQGSEAGRC